MSLWDPTGALLTVRPVRHVRRRSVILFDVEDSRLRLLRVLEEQVCLLPSLAAALPRCLRPDFHLNRENGPRSILRVGLNSLSSVSRE